MPYVIKSTKFDSGTKKEYTFYFKGETMFGMANLMTSLSDAAKYEHLSEARRIKRMRFGNAKTISIEKV